MKRLVLPALAAVVGLTTALVPASAEAAPRFTSAIVFISDRDSPLPDNQQDDVYLYDTRTGLTSRMTNDAQVERYPVLSPDGRHVAYTVAGVAGIEVCAISRAGRGWTCGKPRGLVGYPVNGGSTLGWTDDGRSIVFSGQETGEPDSDVYRIDVRGFDPADNLTDEPPGAPEESEYQPTVSPDGRFVVYSLNGDLWRRRIDGSHPLRLTNTAPPIEEYGAEFSPDGSSLAFHSNRRNPVSLGTDDVDVYLMAARPESATNRARDLTGGVVAPSGGPGRERFPTFSPDGRRIAFAFSDLGVPADPNRDFEAEIYTVRIDGSDLENVTANNPTEPGVPPVGDIQPDWGFVRR